MRRLSAALAALSLPLSSFPAQAASRTVADARAPVAAAKAPSAALPALPAAPAGLAAPKAAASAAAPPILRAAPAPAAAPAPSLVVELGGAVRTVDARPPWEALPAEPETAMAFAKAFEPRGAVAQILTHDEAGYDAKANRTIASVDGPPEGLDALVRAVERRGLPIRWRGTSGEAEWAAERSFATFVTADVKDVVAKLASLAWDPAVTRIVVDGSLAAALRAATAKASRRPDEPPAASDLPVDDSFSSVARAFAAAFGPRRGGPESPLAGKIATTPSLGADTVILFAKHGTNPDAFAALLRAGGLRGPDHEGTFWAEMDPETIDRVVALLPREELERILVGPVLDRRIRARLRAGAPREEAGPRSGDLPVDDGFASAVRAFAAAFQPRHGGPEHPLFGKVKVMGNLRAETVILFASEGTSGAELERVVRDAGLRGRANGISFWAEVDEETPARLIKLLAKRAIGQALVPPELDWKLRARTGELPPAPAAEAAPKSGDLPVDDDWASLAKPVSIPAPGMAAYAAAFAPRSSGGPRLGDSLRRARLQAADLVLGLAADRKRGRVLVADDRGLFARPLSLGGLMTRAEVPLLASRVDGVFYDEASDLLFTAFAGIVEVRRVEADGSVPAAPLQRLDVTKDIPFAKRVFYDSARSLLVVANGSGAIRTWRMKPDGRIGAALQDLSPDGGDAAVAYDPASGLLFESAHTGAGSRWEVRARPADADGIFPDGFTGMKRLSGDGFPQDLAYDPAAKALLVLVHDDGAFRVETMLASPAGRLTPRPDLGRPLETGVGVDRLMLDHARGVAVLAGDRSGRWWLDERRWGSPLGGAAAQAAPDAAASDLPVDDDFMSLARRLPLPGAAAYAAGVAPSTRTSESRDLLATDLNVHAAVVDAKRRRVIAAADEGLAVYALRPDGSLDPKPVQFLAQGVTGGHRFASLALDEATDTLYTGGWGPSSVEARRLSADGTIPTLARQTLALKDFGGVGQLVFDPAGRTLIAGQTHVLDFWSARADGSLDEASHGDKISAQTRALAYDPAERLVFTGRANEDGVRVGAPLGQARDTWGLPHPLGFEAQSLAYDPRRRLLAAAGLQGEIVLLRVGKRAGSWTLTELGRRKAPGGANFLRGVAFDEEGGLLAVESLDWDARKRLIPSVLRRVTFSGAPLAAAAPAASSSSSSDLPVDDDLMSLARRWTGRAAAFAEAFRLKGRDGPVYKPVQAVRAHGGRRVHALAFEPKTRTLITAAAGKGAPASSSGAPAVDTLELRRLGENGEIPKKPLQSLTVPPKGLERITAAHYDPDLKRLYLAEWREKAFITVRALDDDGRAQEKPLQRLDLGVEPTLRDVFVDAKRRVVIVMDGSWVETRRLLKDGTISKTVLQRFDANAGGSTVSASAYDPEEGLLFTGGSEVQVRRVSDDGRVAKKPWTSFDEKTRDSWINKIVYDAASRVVVVSEEDGRVWARRRGATGRFARVLWSFQRPASGIFGTEQEVGAVLDAKSRSLIMARGAGALERVLWPSPEEAGALASPEALENAAKAAARPSDLPVEDDLMSLAKRWAGRAADAFARAFGLNKAEPWIGRPSARVDVPLPRFVAGAAEDKARGFLITAGRGGRIEAWNVRDGAPGSAPFDGRQAHVDPETGRARDVVWLAYDPASRLLFTADEAAVEVRRLPEHGFIPASPLQRLVLKRDLRRDGIKRVAYDPASRHLLVHYREGSLRVHAVSESGQISAEPAGKLDWTASNGVLHYDPVSRLIFVSGLQSRVLPGDKLLVNNTIKVWKLQEDGTIFDFPWTSFTAHEYVYDRSPDWIRVSDMAYDAAAGVLVTVDEDNQVEFHRPDGSMKMRKLPERFAFAPGEPVRRLLLDPADRSLLVVGHTGRHGEEKAWFERRSWRAQGFDLPPAEKDGKAGDLPVDDDFMALARPGR